MEDIEQNAGEFIQVRGAAGHASSHGGMHSSTHMAHFAARTGIMMSSSGHSSHPKSYDDYLDDRVKQSFSAQGNSDPGFFEKDRIRGRLGAIIEGLHMEVRDEKTGKVMSTFERPDKVVVESSTPVKVENGFEVLTHQKFLNDKGQLTERDIKESARFDDKDPNAKDGLNYKVEVLSENTRVASPQEIEQFKKEQSAIIHDKVPGFGRDTDLSFQTFSDNAANPHRGTHLGWQEFKQSYVNAAQGPLDSVSRRSDVARAQVRVESLAEKELEAVSKAAQTAQEASLKKMSFEPDSAAPAATPLAGKAAGLDANAIEGHMLSEKLHYDANKSTLTVEQVSGAVVRQAGKEDQLATLHSTMTYNEQTKELRINQELQVQDTQGEVKTFAGPLNDLKAVQVRPQDVPSLISLMPAMGPALKEHFELGENRTVVEPVAKAPRVLVDPNLLEQASIAMSVVVTPEVGKQAMSDTATVLLTNAAINQVDVKVTQGEHTRDAGELIAQTTQLLQQMEDKTAKQETPAKQQAAEREI